ncbi:E3 ubiquitin-protein ligase COP1 isoform X13 [Macaca thibetana thibetana]|uniref:E3 ubiquitin-protein ligase COP1 isoform X20 n=2 Tax=Macaca fascicularis TaxID=9541 RepID=UPI0007600F26|nr:E3 ubiquitin-protein ligase COP1 isoform X15 [Macaca fascicularis]XP_050623132.1 E3 ubiquitin-protein ligase COP1 isoform X13 [Macaca thibetana thibetana]
MSGSRQAGSGSAGTSPGSSAASSVTSASSSLSSSPSPPSVAASAAALVSGGAAQPAGSGGLGGPVRPVLVAPAVSGSGGGAVSTGLSRHSCVARPSAGVGGSSSSLGSGSRKRPLLAPLCNGLINSYEDKSNDFVCPICFDMIEEAYMTKCGHSFWNRMQPSYRFLWNSSRLQEEIRESSIIDSTEYSQPPGFSGSSQTKKQPWYNSTLASRRKRLTAHFEDLEQCYFSTRMSRISDDSRTASQLDEFQECLSKFTRYNSVRPLATLSYASDLYNGSSIVSSIEFDRDCDYFAIAGVTKKIKVYEYGTVIQDAVDIHYPENEMTCNSKISCISWSSYHKNLLASSDYEGTVILWDGFTGQRSKVYQEHEKRCWSVDFNLMDPKLLASGSDDAKVKLWSTNLDNSVASIEAKANVCCVKFSPSSRYHLAFGCADHCVHYYDLRNTKQPIMVFKGHRKAVSYAKFVSGEEIVSASTDSQLKLWNVGKPYCLRSFKGHINEKNFVGLASNGDYIACGSENNSLYLYYKGLSKTLLTFKFDTVKSVLDKDRKEDDTNEFVSAVCWRALPDGESNVLIAANSQGTIKVSYLLYLHFKLRTIFRLKQDYGNIPLY